MNTQTEITSLADLEYIPYLNESGLILEDFQGQIGVYAIYDQDKILQLIGYSRNIYLSLKQYLVRQTDNCYWLKYQAIAHPNRTVLEEIRQAWITQYGQIPPGNGEDESKWNQGIDIKAAMTEPEKQEYQQSEEMERIKLLKKIGRRIETKIEEQLKKRGVQMEIRFNPKLKEQGVLDLKP